MIAERFPRIRVVLSRTSHPGNIGSAARAMKTMGLSTLVLVSPANFPDKMARVMSSGAFDILDRARVCGSLEEALEGAALAVAFTARQRDLSHEPADIRDLACEALDVAAGQDVALVFGNETAGLTNEEVMLCNRLAHIPAEASYSSLNLGAAVQVVAYEFRRAALAQMQAGGDACDASAGTIERAPMDDVERFYEHLEASILRSGFLDPKQPRRLMERMRRLFGRAGLEREELNILRGMLRAWDEGGKGLKGRTDGS